jgi:osmoprotectant transport system permease protein
MNTNSSVLHDLWYYLSNYPHDVLIALVQHILLVLYGSVIAIVLGVVIGILISRNKRARSIVIGIASVLYTIPLFALFGFLITMIGIGTTPAIIALVVYGILPILRNTSVGINQVSAAALEVARGMGANRSQVLFRVELPLAFPVIFAGIRTSVVMNFSIATYAIFIGAGGMGSIIMQGLRTYNNGKLLAGTIVVALATILLDRIIGLLEKGVNKRYGFSRA